MIRGCLTTPAILLIAVLIPAGFAPSGARAEEGTAVTLTLPGAPYYAAPEKMTFCGQPVPLDLPEVWERLDQEFTIVVYSHAQVYLWLKRLNRHFPEIEAELWAQGLPEDLKYVAVAESDLRNWVSSPAGAHGPWQFMPSTGENYGLRLDHYVDERLDFDKSTRSALRYLKDLYGIFDDWALAVAAYNCGEARVKNAMKEQGVKNYYELELPLETERYVLRILAIKEVLSNPEKYGYELPPRGVYSHEDLQTVKLKLNGAVPIRAAAKLADVSYRTFKIFNPCFKADVIPAGTHALKIPSSSDAAEFKKKLPTLRISSSANGSYHRVRKGDTLSRIAKHYKVGIKELRSVNRLRGSTIVIGQKLRIP